MRHIAHYTFFLVLLYISESFAGNLTAPVGFPTGIAELIPAQASRTAGVAPLSVFFNANLTPSSPTERSFHDYEYSWDFGEPIYTSDGNWGTSGKSKNQDKGPVAAHVYETPGTHIATLTVRDSSGTIIDTKQFTITVTDPNVVFSGTNTTCISDSTRNDFNGCPVGAAQVATDDIADISNYTDAGERVLLHRGSSWTMSDNIPFPYNTGPVHIGAYGDCVSPDELGICSNAPQITITGGDAFLITNSKEDWRISDLYFTGTKGVASIFQGNSGMKNQLILRVKSEGLKCGVLFSHWRYNDSDYTDKISVVSSKIQNFSDYAIYIGSENMALMGNVLANSDITHAIRTWQIHKGVIAHNIVSGTSLVALSGRHDLKLHGPSEDLIGSFAETGNGGVRVRTKYAVVSSNVFGSSGTFPVKITPQNDVKDERLSDIIVEKNRIIADFGEQSVDVDVGIIFSGAYLTARNNVIDLTDASPTGGIDGVYILQTGVEPAPVGISVYNNTIYRKNSGSYSCEGVVVLAGANDVTIRNNYASFPGATGTKTMIRDESGNAVTSNNVLTDVPYFVDPDNANPLLRDFSLTAASTEAIDKGTVVPVIDDFSGDTRTQKTYDIGMDEFN